MWEQLTPADVERAKQPLAQERSAILARHAAELEGRTAEERQINDFERVVRVFTEKYVSVQTGSERSIAFSTEQPAEPPATIKEKPPAAPLRQHKPDQHLDIHQQISPQFKPFRRRVGARILLRASRRTAMQKKEKPLCATGLFGFLA